MSISARAITVNRLSVCLLIALGCSLFAQQGDPMPPPGVKPQPIDEAAFLFSLPPPPPPGYAASVGVLNHWLIAYARLTPAQQKWMMSVAVALAGVRQAFMLELIRRDPATALRLELSPKEGAGLPQAVVALLERSVDGQGDYRVDIAELLPAVTPTPNGPPARTVTPSLATVRLARSVLIGERRYAAHVYGQRLGEPSADGVPIQGIAIGSDLALSETVFAAARQDAAPAAEPFGDPLPPLPSGCGALAYPTWTTLLKHVLVIKVDFEDAPGTPIDTTSGQPMTDEFITSNVEEASRRFIENSQGRTCLAPEIVPEVLRMPGTAASYLGVVPNIYTAMSRIRDAGVTAARDYDAAHGGIGLYDADYFDRVVVLFGPIGGQPSAAIASYGHAQAAFHAALSPGGLLHELGHTYGFLHASYWQPSMVSYDSPDYDNALRSGFHEEYGDNWDPMGMGGGDPRSHFNVFFKQYARWIDVADSIAVTESGVYRVYANDRLDAAGVRALRIDADATKTYWVSVRRNFPEDANLSSGVEVRYEMKPTSPFYAYDGVRLLDMTARTATKADHALTSASPASFFDAVNRLRVTVIGAGTNMTGPYVDVQVELNVP